MDMYGHIDVRQSFINIVMHVLIVISHYYSSFSNCYLSKSVKIQKTMRFVEIFRNMIYECSVAWSGCGIRVSFLHCLCLPSCWWQEDIFAFGQAAVELSAHVISAPFV